MIFDERNEGDYRIYAGALEAPRGQGYIAAVVVNRVRGDGPTPREAYRDDSLACGQKVKVKVRATEGDGAPVPMFTPV